MKPGPNSQSDSVRFRRLESAYDQQSELAALAGPCLFFTPGLQANQRLISRLTLTLR